MASRTVTDFEDNETVLVVFTCNHCPYAQAKEDVNAIAADYDVVVGITPNDEEEHPKDSFEKMVEYVDSGRIQFDASLRDESQEVAAAYSAICTPDPFLLARENGGFELAYHGRIDDAPNPDDEPSREEMREAIDAVLAGEAVDLESRPARGCSIKWRPGNEPDY